MQRLWKCEIKWDKSVSVDIYTQWININKQLQFLNNIQFEREVVLPNSELSGLLSFGKVPRTIVFLRNYRNSKIKLVIKLKILEKVVINCLTETRMLTKNFLLWKGFKLPEGKNTLSS